MSDLNLPIAALAVAAADPSPGWLDALDVGSIGAGSLVVITVVCLIRGWIVPKSVLTEIRTIKDTQIRSLTEDRNHWRDAADASAKLAATAQAQADELLEGSRTATYALDAIAKAATGGGDEHREG